MAQGTEGSLTHWILGTVLHLCIILLNKYDSVNVQLHVTSSA